MSSKLKNDLILLLVAFIWGAAFVAQSIGADHLGAFTFNSFRYTLAVIALLPVIFILDKKKASDAKYIEENSKLSDEEKKIQKSTLIKGGIATGAALFVATSLQQYAMAFTTAAKAGFITTLYVILVPIVSIFLKKKVSPLIWFCAVLGVVGLYLLSIKPGSFSISIGDFFVLLCAFAYTAHILIISHFSPKVDGVKMSCIQFAVVSVASYIAMFLTEQFTLTDLKAAIIPLLYAGIMSSAVAYTLQIIAMKDANPTVASLIMSLESVFAALTGVVVLHEFMSGREILGSALMFVAIILAQLPTKSEREAMKKAKE